jgi:excisionase family DNA binding protein
LFSRISAYDTARAITLNPDKVEMSTFEAARYLNVSRPYVIKLLDEGKMPYRRVDNHRRIPIEQVKEFRRSQDEVSYAAMAELQALAQEEELHT